MEKKPTSKELETYQNEVIKEVKEETARDGGKWGIYADTVKKMQNFLSFVGEKRSTKTGLRFYEHIPRNIAGIASDELAMILGIDEQNLMETIVSSSMGGESFSSRKIKLPKTAKLKGVFVYLSPIYHDLVKEWLERKKNKIPIFSLDILPQAPKDLISQYYQYLQDKTKKEWKKKVYQSELSLILKREKVYLPFLLK